MRRDVPKRLSRYAFYQSCIYVSDVPPGFDAVIEGMAEALDRVRLRQNNGFRIRSVRTDDAGALTFDWIIDPSVSERARRRIERVIAGAIEESGSVCFVCGSPDASRYEQGAFARCEVHRYLSPGAVREFEGELESEERQETDAQLRRVFLEAGCVPGKVRSGEEVELKNPEWLKGTTMAALIAYRNGDDACGLREIRGFERLPESAFEYGVSGASQLAAIYACAAARANALRRIGVPIDLARGFLRINGLDLHPDAQETIEFANPIAVEDWVRRNLMSASSEVSCR